MLGPNETRTRKGKERTVVPADLVNIAANGQFYQLNFPVTDVDPAQALPPLEIVDGQHRLLATDLIDLPDDYEVPVVMFDNLPLTWQAYLFWVINVEPKRINTSLAFDLYPELRDQEWLKQASPSRSTKSIDLKNWPKSFGATRPARGKIASSCLASALMGTFRTLRRFDR